MSRNTYVQNLLVGQAGVHRVASELQLRGFNVLFPSVDHGYDLEIEGGLRIQVKSAHLAFRPTQYKGQGAYYFKLGKSPVTHLNRIVRRRTQVFSQKSHFVILWGIDQGRFWVVPAHLLDNKQLVVVGPDVSYRNLDVDKIREMHGSGSTQKEIGEVLGVDQMTVSRRLRGQFLEESRTVSSRVRECEGRWDYIQSYLTTLMDAEESASLGSSANRVGSEEQK